MTSFQVNPVSLNDLSNRLVVVHSHLMDTKAKASGYRGMLGSGELDDALGNFASKWDDSFNVLETKMGDIINRLRAAASGYQGTETEISRAAGG